MRRCVIGVWLVVGVIALAVNLVVGLKVGLSTPVISDARHFLNAAESVASGMGYVDKGTFWPDQPSMQRLPGWPLAIATGLRLFPQASHDAVARLLCLVLNAGVAVLLSILASRLTGSTVTAAVSGLAYAIHPTGLYFAQQGLSEPLFLIFAVGGLICALENRRSCQLVGGLLLGLACLVRANFVLWLPAAIGLSLLVLLSRRNLPSRRDWSTALMAAVLFCAPPALWLARNYAISGSFPVSSTLRGQSFYGANNGVVANDLGFWGYWVFPNDVPGETACVTLAETMSESDVDEYYFQKGKQFVRANMFTMPRLLLGKLIRGYVPMPWKASWGAYAVSIYRWLIYLAAAVGLFVGWQRVSVSFRVMWLAMLFTNLTTVLMFYGSTRLSFTFEPCLLPFVGLGVVNVISRACPRVFSR